MLSWTCARVERCSCTLCFATSRDATLGLLLSSIRLPSDLTQEHRFQWIHNHSL